MTVKPDTNKFLELATESDEQFADRLQDRAKNKSWLRASYSMSVKILAKLDELGWTQKTLAAKMDITPQQVNKMLRGRLNPTLDTIVKLQEVLDIPLLASYYEDPAKTAVRPAA